MSAGLKHHQTRKNGTGANGASSRKHRVFIVDDHPVTRTGVATLVNREADMEICGEADNALDAFTEIQNKRPDLALIDISLKKPNGIELLKNLRAVMPGLRTLIMSMHDEELYAERALRAGAQGYIMKEEAGEKIVHAVRKILKGEPYLSEKMKNRVLHHVMGVRKHDSAHSIHSLSDREMEVFNLIGDGFSTRDIAEKLTLSVKTIDSYREHLKLKLGLKKGSDLVRYAIQWVKSLNVV